MNQPDPTVGGGHLLTPLIDALLAGEPLAIGRLGGEPLPIPDGDSVLDRAFAGLYLAINTVSAADHEGRERERGQRRDLLLDRRQHLSEHPVQEGPVGGAILRGEMTAEQALMGDGRWEQMLDDTVVDLCWAADSYNESLRKSIAIGDALIRALRIAKNTDQSSGHTRTEHTPAINAVAAGQIRQLIREILDLDENTATISTTEWMTRHGLE